MIVMEGLVLVPPERGTIIGRALWKTRYMVLGTGAHLKTQTDLLSESSTRSSGSRKGLKSASSKPSLMDMAQQEQEAQSQEPKLYVSIYKAKGDWEFLAQHPVSAFKSCEIRAVQHRKQGPSLPTMMLDFKPDSISEKQRKRRSSRTAGLTSKDPWAGVLLFRTVPEERYNIYDWQSTLKPKLSPEGPEDSPVSPSSPSFGSFTNPFASKTPSGSLGKPEFHHRSSNQNMSTYPHSPRDRERPSALISPSPSLRSRRSDLSSQASSLHPPMGFTTHNQNNYTTTLPSDLPSPASTSGYDTQFIEGWTSAQGRSSALSSHTRGSNSIASAVAPIAPVGSTPPGPRETILDRAFQMRYIPGGERVPDGSGKDDEKISSIARFEALMREVDERKRQKSITSQDNIRTRQMQDWDLDEESEEESSAEIELDNDDVEEDEDGLDIDIDMSDHDHEISIPTPAQRALDYISGKRTPLPSPSPSSSTKRPLSPTTTPRNQPIPFLNPQAMSAFHGGPPLSPGGGLRPRAGTTSSRNNTSRPSSLALPSRSVSAATIPSLKDLNHLPSNLSSSNLASTTTTLRDREREKEKRRSSTSTKRLSFQEFAKRLSSNSSLLLVQTNGSSSSSRSSGGFEEGAGAGEGGRGDRSERERERERDRDKRCGWRGSVGVFGEGGFL